MKKDTWSILIGFIFVLNGVFAQPVPTAGLQVHYPFTGNTNDESGNGFNGVNNGATLTADRFDNPNSAFDFSSAGYIDCNNILNTPLSGTNTNFTISFWVQPSGNNNNNMIIAKHADAGCSDNQRQFFIRSYNNTINVEYFGSVLGTDGRFLCATTLLDNFTKWYHVVVVYDGSVNTGNGLDRVQVYLDNSIEATSLTCRTQSGSFPFDLVAGNAHLGIGNYLNSSGNPCLAAPRYNGKIDDIRIYDRILNGSEITQLFNEGGSGGVGMHNNDFSPLIKVYPNPATDFINIENVGDINNGEICLENLLGQKIYSTVIPMDSKTNVQLDVSGYPRGVYLLQLILDGKSMNTEKIILQ